MVLHSACVPWLNVNSRDKAASLIFNKLIVTVLYRRVKKEWRYKGEIKGKVPVHVSLGVDRAWEK